MDLGLSGRAYVLTGASRGLGYATAECLVEDGANVVISSRHRDRVAEAAHQLGPERATGIDADLADPQTPQRLISAALDRFGRLDGALISVGGPPTGTVAAATDDQWLNAFQSIFLGAIRTARTIASGLTDGGAIGLVLSTSARAPIPGLGISNALRPGLMGAVKDMADEFGPRGVRVISLLPGRVLTARSAQLFAGAPDPAAARAHVETTIPLRRIASPVEFGRAAAFLLSPAASYITGVAIPIDGGATRAL